MWDSLDLLSLGIMFSRFFHIMACIISACHSSSCSITQHCSCIYRDLFIRLSIYGHLIGFHSSAVKGVVNSEQCYCEHSHTSVCLSRYRVIWQFCIQLFVKSPNCFHDSGTILHCPQQMYCSFCFCEYNNPHGYKVVPHCDYHFFSL